MYSEQCLTWGALRTSCFHQDTIVRFRCLCPIWNVRVWLPFSHPRFSKGTAGSLCLGTLALECLDSLNKSQDHTHLDSLVKSGCDDVSLG